MESFLLNPRSFSEGIKRKIKPRYKKVKDQESLELTVKKETHSLIMDEYLLAEENTELRTKLQCYYKDLFPFEEICTWLCYGNYDTLNCREFSYVILPNRFRRHKTFDYFREMKFEICKLCPVKIDVGAIFNMRPAINYMNKNMIAYAIERELIFDIDLSDYDNIRSCCEAANICQKCWKFVAAAVKIMHTSFVEDFGWKHILWVFSGRRGIHCWVCDPDVRSFNEKQREQILTYYELEKPGLNYDYEYDDDDKEKDKDDDEENDADEKHNDFENKPRDPFALKHRGRSYIFANKYFVEVCLIEQDILRTPEGVDQFISLIPTLPCRKKVTELFAEGSTSLEKWHKFKKYWKTENVYQKKLRTLHPHLIKHIVLWYLYPRIDVPVSMGMSHLLKVPFSFHPTTLLLCTPFDPYKVDEFNVSEVPSLEQLSEFAKLGRSASEITSTDSNQIQRYAKSRLVFENFLKI